MIKKISVVLIIGFLFLINPFPTLAQANARCTQSPCPAGFICDPDKHTCVDGYSCQLDIPTDTYLCQKDPFSKTFGRITPPNPLKGFIKESPSGRWAISHFLSNLIVLIYSIAAVVLVFMLIWGAFEWLTSGGDKEKIEAARKRIINAIIGMMLFAVAFAVIRVLGVFTGFKFFVGQ